ncbi:MAG TPA: DUF1549 and DUF1553 domain-containing protein [Pirellulales bacterium]
MPGRIRVRGRFVRRLTSAVLAAVVGWLGSPALLRAADAISSADAPESAATEATRAKVSYRRDVAAVLSKSGCNMGLCHGNQNGKGGFKLSLRGEDPDGDYAALTRSVFSRRVNSENAEASLLLRKATMQVAHEGGRRFLPGSLEYTILRDWIAQGAKKDSSKAPRVAKLTVEPAAAIVVDPQMEIAVRVQATFTDGSVRDVTRLAVFETSNPNAVVSLNGIVKRESFGETTVLIRYLTGQAAVPVAFAPARPDYVWPEATPDDEIDRLVAEKLKALTIAPSELCDDGTFLRRAYLDLLGVLPTADEARKFVADSSPDKRSRLVERLLNRPEYAEFWGLKWADLLRCEEETLDKKGIQAYQAWIRRAVADNRPLNEFVREIVSARGSTYSQPATNFYRAMRDPVTRAEATAQVFLGTRLQCAKCHNHPFDRWSQDDYYHWTAYFGGVDYKILENDRKDKNDGHQFDGEQVVFYDRSKAKAENPRTNTDLAPQPLGEPQSAPTKDVDPLEQLADWIVSPSNPLFARVQVNRVWNNLMGRGIVEPIDDFRATNPPSNPALLEHLTADFVAHGYDVKRLIRQIMNSRTYQRSSEPNETNRDDEANFSHGKVRRLTAEQLLDALHQTTGVAAQFRGYPRGMRAAQLPAAPIARRGLNPDEQFLKTFGKPPRLLSCECERSDASTLVQAFQMISGELVNNLITAEGNRLKKLLDGDRPTPAIVDDLYWTVLSRAPTQAELTAAVQQIDASPNRREPLEDLLWSLLNAKEFVLRD